MAKGVGCTNLDCRNFLPELTRKSPTHRDRSKPLLLARVSNRGLHVLLQLLQRPLERPHVRVVALVRPLGQDLPLDRVQGLEDLGAFDVSGDGDVKVLRPVELPVVLANFLDGGRLSEVGQLAAGLRRVAVVARIEVLDHREEDNVRGLVLDTLEGWNRKLDLNLGSLAQFVRSP